MNSDMIQLAEAARAAIAHYQALPTDTSDEVFDAAVAVAERRVSRVAKRAALDATELKIKADLAIDCWMNDLLAKAVVRDAARIASAA